MSKVTKKFYYDKEDFIVTNYYITKCETLINFLQKAILAGYSDLEIYAETDGYDVIEEIDIIPFVKRLETDEEYRLRLEAQELQEKRLDDWEYKQYLQLKEKYEK